MIEKARRVIDPAPKESSQADAQVARAAPPDDTPFPRLTEIAMSWIGTPFFPHGRAKGPGGGCSCQTLGFCIYQELGHLPPELPLPRLSLRSYRAGRVSQIDKFISETLPHKFARVEHDLDLTILELLRPGDFLIFLNKDTEHSGIYLGDGQFIHCLLHDGTVLGSIRDATYLMSLTYIWRPIV